MRRSSVAVDSWPWMLWLLGAFAVFVVLRPPLLLLWTYGLHPPEQESQQAQEIGRAEPMPLPRVPDTLSQPRPAIRPRAPEVESILNPLEQGIFDGTNRERIDLHRVGLQANPDLAQVAAQHSRQMRDLGFFAHDAPDSTGSADRAGKEVRRTFGTVEENIAKLTERPNLAEVFVDGWMNSPVDRAKILDAVRTDLGVGCAEPAVGDTMRWTHCTQLFMAVYANLRQPFPDPVTEGQKIAVEIVAENGNPLPTRLRQVRLQTGEVKAQADLRERSAAAAGALTMTGPPGVYRLEVEIPDPKVAKHFWIIPGPYVTVQP